VSSRALLFVYVAIAAVASAGIVVGLTLDTRDVVHQPAKLSGKPPVPSNLPGPSGKQIEQAFREWPNGSISTMQQLGLRYPKDALVQYYRGIALLWDGYTSDAESALESAKKLGRNTPLQGKADNVLHPSFYAPQTGPPFYPVYSPIGKNPLLEQGSRLQTEGHQVSAEKLYSQAVRKDPNNVEALVAQAVALFDEDNLTPAFSRLGPLTQRFPKSQIPHYYFGLLLAWTANPQGAVSQFKKAYQLDPTSQFGKAAKRFLDGIESAQASASRG
jgi:tetratricopeptide (TPR) repeat protein